MKIFQIAKTIFEAITCAIQIFTWISTLRMFLNIFHAMGGKKAQEALANTLGFASATSLTKLLDDTEKNIVQPVREKHAELGQRLGQTPSNLNGMHKPNYHSTVILEATYAYDSLRGTGSLILIFNPEGFGFKPRSPQIISNVSEKEMAALLSSPSWGNFWRTNFMTKRKIAHQYENTDWMTGEKYELSPAMDLDEWIENQAMLDPEDSGLANKTINEQINLAIDRDQDVVNKFIHGFENGTLGRPFEDNGLRVTDAFGNRMRNIPKHLSGIISNNPFIKEIAPFSNAFKKYASKWGQLKGVVNSSDFLSSFDSMDWVQLSSLDFEQEAVVGMVSKLGELDEFLTRAGLSTVFGATSKRTRQQLKAYRPAKRNYVITKNDLNYYKSINKMYMQMVKEKEKLARIYGQAFADEAIPSTLGSIMTNEEIETAFGNLSGKYGLSETSTKGEIDLIGKTLKNEFKSLPAILTGHTRDVLKNILKFPTCWKTVFTDKD